MSKRWGDYRLLVFPSLILVATLVVILATVWREAQTDKPGATVEAETSTTEVPEMVPVAGGTPTDEPMVDPTGATIAGPETEPTAVSVPAVAELEAYESVTQFFRVMVPEGWHTAEAVPGADLVMANSEAALERYNRGDAFESGDFVLNVGFLPYRLLQTNELRALKFQFDAPPDVFLQSLLPMFRMDDKYKYGEPELVSLSDEREAGMLTVAAEEGEGLILTFVAGDSIIALVSAVAFPGEMSRFQEITSTVAAGVSFSGAQDALYGTLLGG